jgi:hypothetical protein
VKEVSDIRRVMTVDERDDLLRHIKDALNTDWPPLGQRKREYLQWGIERALASKVPWPARGRGAAPYEMPLYYALARIRGASADEAAYLVGKYFCCSDRTVHRAWRAHLRDYPQHDLENIRLHAKLFGDPLPEEIASRITPR